MTFGFLKDGREMEILVFVLVFSNLNLVLAEDTVPIENTAAPKGNGNAHTPQETNEFFNDQLAESSQSVAKALGNVVVIDDEKATGIERAIQLSDNSRNGAVALSPIQVPQSHQYVRPQEAQQLYLQYPGQQVQILGAEASPLQQSSDSEGPQALGYTSYVEHLSEKDEEEIKAALKDGSVSDIKRLVPKSGISFKIYQSDKSPQIQSDSDTRFGSSTPAELSVLHHKTRGEVSASPLGYRPPRPSDNEEEQYGQQLLQSGEQNQQGLNAPAIHYGQPESYKTLPEVIGKSSSIIKSNFRINVAESNYNKHTGEIQGNQRFSSKIPKQNPQQWNFKGQIGGVQKGTKPGKTLEAFHYVVDPLQNEGRKNLPYAQTQGSGSVGLNLNSHKAKDSLVEASKQESSGYLPDSYAAQTSQNNFAGRFANLAHSDQKVTVNLLPHDQLHAEGIKPGRVIGHLATTPFAATDGQTSKSGQHNLLSAIHKSSYIETKSSHNFDHQKALEGSTPFDIKNAIDGSGSLIHQTNYLSSTPSDVHPLENPQEKPSPYIISKIPTSTVVIDNSISDAVVQAHQDFGHAGLQTTPQQFSYHPAAEVAAKFYHPPQPFLWSSEHLKQGGALASKDLHQQLLRLHLPKEEVYIKTPNVEFPVSLVSQVSLPQHKEPLAFHYDHPFIKSFPQELHFQGKSKGRVQSNPVSHLKPGQPVALDWSLFKSGAANLGIGTMGVKPDLLHQIQEPGKKKIVPVLVRKRKNRSNGKQEIGIVYGKVNVNRRPKKPSHRQEKNIRGNLLSDASNSVKQLDAREERKNEFSVSASYKVDRSSRSS